MIKEFINASAGTGKTYTLLNNIFNYKEGQPTTDYNTAIQKINESVFLTFSNSATEEIRDRIFKGLSKCPNRPVNSLEQDIVNSNIDMKVFTIHSFALEMLKKFRYKLGLPAEIDFSDDSEPIWKNCVNEFFTKKWNYDDIKEIACIDDNNIEQKALFEFFWMLVNKKSFKTFIENKGATLFFLASMGKSSAYNISREEAKKEINTLFQNLNVDIKLEYNLEFQNIANQLTELNGKKIDKSTDCSEENIRFLKNVTSLLNMCSDFTEKFLIYIGEKIYMPQMFVNGIFDFDSIIYLFIDKLVKNNMDEFLQDLKNEDYYFSKLYIDEAQDNDIIQNYFIIFFGNQKCPIEVTIVGDVKQSIYGWRNSYPKEFIEIYKECKESTISNIKVTELNTTRRIETDNTRTAINNVCEKLKNKFASWWYKDSENLQKVESCSESTSAKIQKWDMQKLDEEYQKKLKEFLSEGNNAILISTRDDLVSLQGLDNVIRDLNANLKANSSIAETPCKYNSLNPELDFIKVLFGSLSNDLSSTMPFAMLWSEAGKLVTQNISNKIVRDNFIEELKSLYTNLSKYSQETIYANRIESIFKLFENHKLWNCMQHKYYDKESVIDIRRIFAHILTSAQIAENKKSKHINNKYFNDISKTILEKPNLPLSSYSIGNTNVSENSTDVITIHSSKGLTYDKIVVISNFNNRFFEKAENLKKYTKEYSALYNINFKNILTENPNISISYFPYLDTLPAKFLRLDISLWDKSLDQFKDIKNLIMSENINLLYVALTRTKKDIILIDVSKKSKEETETSKYVSRNGNRMQVVNTSPIQQVEDFFEDFIKCTIDDETEDKIASNYKVSYLQTNKIYNPMDIKSHIKTKSVRNEITSKLNKKYDKGVLDSLDRLEKVKIGSMLHNAIQSTLPATNSCDSFMNEIDLKKKGMTDTSSLQYQALDILSKNRNIIETNEDLLKEKYHFSNEVPIWYFKDDNTLIKGSIDTLAFKENKAVIIEYKVLFNDSQSQKDTATVQMQEYEGMLEKMKTSNLQIEKKYMPFVDAK